MRVLVFAPHPDDEVLGCGGMIARHVAQSDEVTVCIMTCGKPPIYDDTAAKENNWPHSLYPEICASHKLLGVKETLFLQFPAAAMETELRYTVNGKVCQVVNTVKPDVVYIPHFGDMQKDHSITVEAVMVAVRPKGEHRVQSVYAYECLSETEWNVPHSANMFIPNVFVDISEYLDVKLKAMACYRSQLGPFPDPRSLEAVEALAKLRGSTMKATAAEAFMLVREYRQ